MGLRDRLVKGPNVRNDYEPDDAADDATNRAAVEETEAKRYGRASYPSGHPLLRKSPWVDRAEHNKLPAKELKP